MRYPQQRIRIYRRIAQYAVAIGALYPQFGSKVGYCNLLSGQFGTNERTDVNHRFSTHIVNNLGLRIYLLDITIYQE